MAAPKQASDWEFFGAGESTAASYLKSNQAVNLDFLSGVRAYGNQPALTISRASTATVTDFEGLLKTAKANEARITGARRVENLITNSEDASEATLINTGVTVTPVGDGVDDIFLNGLTSYSVRWILLSGVSTYNKTFRMSIKVKGEGDDIGKNITLRLQRAVGTTVTEDLTITLTSEFVRHTFDITLTEADNTGVTSAVLAGLTNSATNVLVTEWQLEEVTGQANQNPSEYVSNGVINRNLLIYTEESWQSTWDGTNTTITSNATTNPFGIKTADKWQRNSTASSYIRPNTVTKTAVAKDYNASWYIKKDTAQYCAIRLQGTYPARADVIFDLDTGTVESINEVTFTNTSVRINSVGDGWYRVDMDTTSNTSTEIKSYISFNANAVILDGTDSSSTSSGYFWGTQLTDGFGVLPYQPVGERPLYHGAGVDGVKYFDYENGNTVTDNVVTEAQGAAISDSILKGYLGEPQVTNLAKYTDKLDESVWILTNATVTDASTGELTLSSTTNFIYQQNITVTPGTEYVFSFYARLGTATGLNYALYDFTNFNFITPSTPYSATTTEQRFSFKFTAPAGCTDVRVYPIRDSATTGTAYIRKVQVEEMPFATSYIPTEASTVTRSPDRIGIDSPIQTDFTIYQNIIPIGEGADYTDNSKNRTYGSDDSRGTNFEIRAGMGSGYGLLAVSSNAIIHQTDRNDLSKDVTAKYSFSAEQNGANVDALIYKDGTQEASQSLASVTLDHSNQVFWINHWNGSFGAFHYKSIQLYPIALSGGLQEGLTN